jgi:hypothetical protein
MPILTYADAVRGHESRPVVSSTAGHRAVHTDRFPTQATEPGFCHFAPLRAGGAMAFLCALLDSDVIKMVGGWLSDQM